MQERLTTQILFEEPPPPQKANPKLPTDLGTIITKATRKDPKERYRIAAELAEDLDRFVSKFSHDGTRVITVSEPHGTCLACRSLANCQKT